MPHMVFHQVPMASLTIYGRRRARAARGRPETMASFFSTPSSSTSSGLVKFTVEDRIHLFFEQRTVESAANGENGMRCVLWMF